MKVLGVGFWKTGTKSLAEAFRILGYKVYDYDYQYLELENIWTKFVNGTVTDDEIRLALEDIDVLVDGPCMCFWEEISRAIPETKVILTTRDEDSWYESYRSMVKPFTFKLVFLLMYFSPTAWHLLSLVQRQYFYCLGVEGPFSIPAVSFNDNARIYKYQFRKHNGHVISSVPKEKLLVFESKEGWEPLCKFLGEEVPDVPYPHKNKRGSHFLKEGGQMHPRHIRLFKQEFLGLAVFVVLISLLVCYLVV